MALVQCNFLSKALMRNVPINVIIPTDKLTFPGMPAREDKPYKTLYLLHGVMGSHIDWICGTNIQRWADEKNLVVVMPAGDNRFYTDGASPDAKYSRYIGEDLIEFTRKTFPLSHKREDTFIAGLSMGGYGALYNGLRHNEVFGYVAGLSAADIIPNLQERKADGQTIFDSRIYAEACFGDLDHVMETDMNLKWRAAQIAKEHLTAPKLYLTVGVDDFLLEANRALEKSFREAGLDVTYVEGPGAHEWDFWDRNIKKVLEWLPLEGNETGIDSGNIGK